MERAVTRRWFEGYVAAFNQRDYARLERDYFAEDVRLHTLGYVLAGHAGIRGFYDFFHRYVDERLEVVDFQPRDGGFYGEVRMALTASRALTQEVLNEAGFGRLPAIPAGATYATSLLIDYRVKDGRLHLIRCAELHDPIR